MAKARSSISPRSPRASTSYSKTSSSPFLPPRPLTRPYKLPWRTLTARPTTCMGATTIPTVRRNTKPWNYSGRYARTVLFARLYIATIDGGAALTHVASHCRQQLALSCCLPVLGIAFRSPPPTFVKITPGRFYQLSHFLLFDYQI